MPYYVCSKCKVRFHGMISEEAYKELSMRLQLCEECFNESKGHPRFQF